MGRHKNLCKDEAVQRAVAGETYKSIANGFGLAVSTIQNYCKESGLVSGWKQKRRKEITDEKVSVALGAICGINSAAEVSRLAGISTSTLAKRVGGSLKNIKCYEKKQNSCNKCGIYIGENRVWTKKFCVPCGREWNRNRQHQFYLKHPEKQKAYNKKYKLSLVNVEVGK